MHGVVLIYIIAAENDWQLPQTVPEPAPDTHTTLEKRYGFLDMYTGYFRHVTTTENEVNELGADTETLPVSERQKRRISHEDEKWDEEHYMSVLSTTDVQGHPD